MIEKEILLAGDPNTKVLVSKLVERLIGRFCGKIQDELGDLLTLLYSLMRRCTGIDHLNGIIQKHIQRGNLPTDEVKLAKLKEAL